MMKLQRSVRPISYVKAHAAELIRDLAETREAVIVTQNGEATAVLQDLESYEQMQESLAMLKLLALSVRDLEAGRARPAAKAFATVRRHARSTRDR
jgi:prevent-host-death family protein